MAFLSKELAASLYRNGARTAVIAAVLFVPACNVYDTTPSYHEVMYVAGPRTLTRREPPNAADYEKDFLHRMSDHEASAIAVESLAAQKAVHREVQNAANTSLGSRAERLGRMELWSRQWYRHELKPEITDEGTARLTPLKSLTGTEFEHAFLRTMLVYDQEAIDLATPAAAQSPHKEVRTMAQDIIMEETKDIAEMRQWIMRGD
jgi:uncharacterized protein (DUF305 family)